MIELVNVVLLGLLAVTALAAIRLHDLFAVTMMFGIYSLLAAVVFIVLDAVDVAFTEAAVRVGISTILMLATIGLVGRQERRPPHRPVLPGGCRRDGRGAGLWNAGHARFRRSGCPGSAARGAPLPGTVSRGDRNSQCGHRGSGELQRL